MDLFIVTLSFIILLAPNSPGAEASDTTYLGVRFVIVIMVMSKGSSELQETLRLDTAASTTLATTSLRENKKGHYIIKTYNYLAPPQDPQGLPGPINGAIILWFNSCLLKG